MKTNIEQTPNDRSAERIVENYGKAFADLENRASSGGLSQQELEDLKKEIETSTELTDLGRSDLLNIMQGLWNL